MVLTMVIVLLCWRHGRW